MGLDNLPDSTRPAEIFGFKPRQVFDRDMGARSCGFESEADLLENGDDRDRVRLELHAESWQKNNDPITDWLENHMKTAQAVHELDTRLDFLEERLSEQAARIRALEARIGIESIED
jgi:hypothetical protein